jgi:hypothetical protein
MKVSAAVYYARSIVNLLLNVAPRSRIIPLFLGRASSQPLIIRLRGNARPRSRGDGCWVIKETCLDRDYSMSRPCRTTGPSSISAQGWATSQCVPRSCPAGRVLAYGPFPESFALLQPNISLNNE